jgi:disulfide bond formation protein DsbB
MTELVKALIPYGVLALQVASLTLLLALLFARKGGLVKWVGERAVLLSFFITLATALGSLFYSSVLGYEPCLLCWWQRIFHFPQFIIFGLALWKRRSDVFLYTAPLSVVGGMFALYHIALPYLGSIGIDCGATGVSCNKQFVLEFGYITIPVMSLSVFVTLILLAITNRLRSNEK